MFNAHLRFPRQRGRKERGMPQRTTEYTETLRLRVPESWPLKVELAARAEEMTATEWHRQVLRDALKKYNFPSPLQSAIRTPHQPLVPEKEEEEE